MEMLRAVQLQDRMEITPSTLSRTELGKTRELSYKHVGGGKLDCTFHGISAPIFVNVREDGTLNFEQTELSFVVWKKVNHNNEPEPY